MATNLTLGTLFTADVNQFLQGIGQIKQAVASLQSTFTQAGQGANAMGTGLASAINKSTTALKAQNAAVKASKQQLEGLAGMWQRVQQAMKTSIAYGTAGAAIYAVIDGLKAGVMAMADYDQALKNLQAITQASESEMLGLADTIKEVSSKYIFSTKEIADGAVLMGQAGFTATQTMQAMDSAAKLAMGTLEDMSLTVDLLTTTIVSFNMKSVESERVADIMANAMNRSKLTLDKLRVAFNYVGNAAHESGISLEETAAAMSVMANAGMRASTIGTAFRQVIANLIAPNRRVREEMQGLGIALTDLDPKVVGFSTVVQNLSRILMDQKTGLVDMTKAYNLFGLRAAQAAAILARSASNDYPRMLAMMYEVGTATTMADKQMEGLIAKFKNLAANAQLIAVAIGEGGVITVLKMLADGLLLVTKAVKNFLESGTGQLISSMAAWSAATAVVMLAVKGLTAFILGALIPGLISYAKAIKDVVWAMAALQGVGLIDKLNMLLSVLVRGNPIFLAYAVILGSIFAAYKYLEGAQERQIESSTRVSNAYRTVVDTLGSYQAILEKLAERQKKGQDIQVEYEAVIKRLLRDYPQLTGVIDSNVESLQKNNEEIKKYKSLALDKYIEEQIVQIKMYDQQLEKTGKRFSQFSNMQFGGQIEQGFEDIAGASQQLEQEFSGLAKSFNATKMSADDIVASFGEAGKSEKEVGEEAKKTSAILKEQDQRWVNMGKAMKEAGFGVDYIIDKLRGFGASEAIIKTVTDALHDFSEDVSQEAKAIEAAMQNLPHVFTPLFNSLDAMSKVSFAKSAAAMEKEIAEYEKTAKAVLKSEEDKYAALAFIRTKHLMKFADDVLKEQLTAEQLLKVKQNLIEEEKRLVNERIDTLTSGAINAYKAELEKAGDNAKKREDIEKKLADRLIEINKSRVQAMSAIDQGAQGEIVANFKKVSEEVVDTGRKMADDYIKELDRMIKSSTKKIEQMQKKIIKTEMDYDSTIRKLKQRGMSDSEKYADDERNLNSLLNMARQTKDEEYYKEAADAAKDLVREVKDKNGNIVKSEKDTADKVIGYLQTIKAEHLELLKKEKEEEQKKIEAAKTLMADMKQALVDYGGEWDKINQTKLANFISSLNDVVSRMESIEESTSNIRKDWEVVTSKYAKTPKPEEPSKGSKTGLDVITKIEGQGTINGIDVNKLAGQGGQINGQDVNALAGQGQGTIGVGGKLFDVKQLSEYEGKVQAISEKIQAEIKTTQESVVQGAEESGKQAVETVGKVGTDITAAITAATDSAATSIGTAVETAKTAETSIGDMSTSVSNISTAALEVNNQFVTLGFNAENVKNRFVELRDLIIEIASKPLTELITQGALDILTNVEATLKRIKTDWDSLKSKTITLTINTVQSGGGGGGGSGGGGSSSGGDSGSDSGGAGGMSDWGGGSTTPHEEHRWGGLVGALKNIVTFASKGVKLPGYGGGDRVPVMAEAGEYIVNKESTSRFLPIIEAINSNAVSVADFGKRFGGVIRASMPKAPVPAYAMGGQVQNRSSGGNTFIFKVKPTYMTGDRSSVRKVAADLSKAMEDMKKGRGYSNG